MQNNFFDARPTAGIFEAFDKTRANALSVVIAIDEQIYDAVSDSSHNPDNFFIRDCNEETWCSGESSVNILVGLPLGLKLST